MNQQKTALFTPGLVIHNKTLSRLSQATLSNPNVTVFLHEAVSGRYASDIASAYWNYYWNFVIEVKCNEPTILWLDNCSAKNKNRTLI